MKKSFYKMSVVLSLLFSQSVFAEESAISRGEYLAQAGDCMACHTNNPDKPYAGGHGLASPIGTIYATNITPDKTFGIGQYSYEDFDRAVRHGVNASGDPLYPAMPFVSYAKMTNDDTRALYDYFMNDVQPIAEPNRATDIEWPLNMRFPMHVWNKVFTNSEVYVPDATKSDEWNRGAYLVQGLGHCGTCHTPRSITLVEQGLNESSETFLSGAELGGWYAPNLRTLNEENDELFRLLKDGRNTHHAFAGPMADVTSYSLNHLTDDDVNSIIVYLRAIQLPPKVVDKVADKIDVKSEGYITYQEFCSTCHGRNGEGVDNVAPNLTKRGNGEQGRSYNIAQVLLSGAKSAHKDGRLPYEMPAYKNKFSDEQIAQLTNFIMNNDDWQNYNQKITAKDVQNLRDGAIVIKGWWFIAGAVGFLFLVLCLWKCRRKKVKA